MNPGSTWEVSSKETGELNCYGWYTSGATGAVTTVTKLKGVATIARSNVGIIVFTLLDPVVDVLDVSAHVIQASPSNTGGGGAYTWTYSASAGTVTVTFRRNSDFAATDTTTSDLVKVKIVAKVKQ